MENQRTGTPYSGKYSNEGSELANHTPLTRIVRSVVVTNNKPTTTMDAFDYHHIRGEAKDTTRQPNEMPNCRSSAC